MTKTDQLLIRACKSTNPRERLNSVYRRFYNKYNPDEDIGRYLIIILCRIVEENNIPIKLIDILSDLHPKKDAWLKKEVDPYEDRCISYLISKIRLCERKYLIGLTPPARFKTKEMV